MCLLGYSMMNNHIYGSKVPQNLHFGGLNWHFKPNVRIIQVAISSDLCVRLTRNLTGSCMRPAAETSWVVLYGGKTIPIWRTAAILKIDISPYLSEKSLDIHEILYTAADFELDERHVMKNEKVVLDRLWVRRNIPVFLVSIIMLLTHYSERHIRSCHNVTG